MLASPKANMRSILGAIILSSAVILSAAFTPAYADNPALTAASGALKSGRFAYVIKTLNKALKNGGLSTKDMSKALLYRGLAYQSTHKSAQSIADLTNAIWMGGLTSSERAEALKYRALAYGAGGVSDRAKADKAEATRLARSLPKVASLVGKPAKPVAKPSGGFGSGLTSGLTTGVSDFFGNILPGSSSPAPAAAAVSKKAAEAKAYQEALKTAQAQAATQAATQAAAKTAANAAVKSTAKRAAGTATRSVVSGWSTDINKSAQAPAKKPTTSSGFGLGGVTDFFGNVFGGSSNAPQAPAIASAPKPAVSGFTTKVSTSAKAPVKTAVKTAALDVKRRSVPVRKAKPRGRYRLQIATVRSKDEANTIVSSINARHRTLVARHPARIDEAVVGNMGTFYRVRLEAFDSRKTALKTCNALRASGLDCFPVDR